MADRRRTELVKGKEVNFTYLPHTAPAPDFEKVTSVCVIPFTDDGQMVATIIDWGIDFPGGHVQHGEATLQQTADREAMEEAHGREILTPEAFLERYQNLAPEDTQYLIKTAITLLK